MEEARSNHYLVNIRTLTVHYFELITTKITNVTTPLVKLNIFDHNIHHWNGTHEKGVGTIECLRALREDQNHVDLLDCDVVKRVGFASDFLDHHIGHALATLTVKYAWDYEI